MLKFIIVSHTYNVFILVTFAVCLFLCVFMLIVSTIVVVVVVISTMSMHTGTHTHRGWEIHSKWFILIIIVALRVCALFEISGGWKIGEKYSNRSKYWYIVLRKECSERLLFLLLLLLYPLHANCKGFINIFRHWKKQSKMLKWCEMIVSSLDRWHGQMSFV